MLLFLLFVCVVVGVVLLLLLFVCVVDSGLVIVRGVCVLVLFVLSLLLLLCLLCLYLCRYCLCFGVDDDRVVVLVVPVLLSVYCCWR